MNDRLPKRSEVPENLKWDTSLIYKSSEEMKSELSRVETMTKELVDRYKGKLTDTDSIINCLKDYCKVIEIIILVREYVGLNAEVDYTDSEAQNASDEVCFRINDLSSSLSFIDSELSALSKDILNEAMEKAPEFQPKLRDILKWKDHMMSPEAEELLSALGHLVDSPYNIYNTAKLADMSFPDFEAGGRTYPLGYSLFEDDYEYNENTEVRRTAFNVFSNKLRDYVNVTAAAYNTQVQYEKTIATKRKFDSVIDYLLFDQDVTRDMYDRQIDVIMTELAPHMRRYADLIKKIHKLDRMTYADLKLPVDCTYDPKVTIDGARDYLLKGLSVMGEDYKAMINKAFSERWVDFAKNFGKCTGGFCASPYGRNSFILLSWNDRMSDVFTLGHELGHAGHFKACNSAQNILNADVSTYFVEAPSTTNELIMAHYMLKTNTDKRFRRWVLANMVSNTYYHNFVTHLLEAAYQREVYRKVDNGESLQAETLSEIMKDTLKKFWGDAVELTDGAELTWMRQPHYYMGLYSYTYSAGLTIGTEVCERIEKEGVKAVEDWKKVLAAGKTRTTVELAKMAGVDITTDAALKHTIGLIGSYIDEIIKLSEELGDC